MLSLAVLGAAATAFAKILHPQGDPYVAAANSFAAAAITARHVSYGELITQIYGANADAIRAEKARYRSAHPGVPCLADYGQIDKTVELRRSHVTHDVVYIDDGRQATGQYSKKLGIIFIYGKTYSGTTVYHELGHTLQEPAIASSIEYPLGCEMSAEQFRYLIRQDEFEIRLQDLNRLFFTVTGKAIGSSIDAAAALRLIGVKLTPHFIAEVSGADRKDIETSIRSVRAIDSSAADAWPQAFQLRDLLNTAGVDDATFAAIATKILTEAPLHM